MQKIEYSIDTTGYYDGKSRIEILPRQNAILPIGVYFAERYNRPYDEFKKKSIQSQWQNKKFLLHAIITDDKYFTIRGIETHADYNIIASLMNNNTKMLSMANTYYEFTNLEIKAGDKINLDTNCNYYFIIHILNA